MMAALIQALGNVSAQEEPEEDEPAAAEYDDKQNEKEEPDMNANTDDKGVKTFSEQDVERIVANQLRRQKVMDKLIANEQCAFEESDLRAMNIEALEKYEKSIRPVDYSGAGGFATNSDAVDTNVTPLRSNGVLGKISKKEA